MLVLCDLNALSEHLGQLVLFGGSMSAYMTIVPIEVIWQIYCNRAQTHTEREREDKYNNEAIIINKQYRTADKYNGQ